MTLAFAQAGATGAVEGPPGEPLLATADEVRLVIEACFEQGARAALLYAPNLPPAFFDLSSGEAGSLLQRLQNYQIRLALVVAAGTPMSSRFRELLAESQQGRDFGVFASREAAIAWLAG
jgi:hypothetical protein